MVNIQKLKEKINSKACLCGFSSQEVSLAKSLVENKCKLNNLFICEGLWAVDKLISKGFKITHFFFNYEKLSNYSYDEIVKIEKLARYAEQTFAISSKTCKKISDRDGYDEEFIIAELKTYSLNELEEQFRGKTEVLAIVMDGLEQPGNIGAILRSFDACGGDFAIVTNKKAKLTNSRLVRSSLGASFMLPVAEAEIGEVQEWFMKNGYKCVVTDLQATKNYKEANYDGKVVIVAGNEHTGISNSWRTLKNSQSVIIPMLGSVESLNVGFASTLVAYEAGLQKFATKNELKNSKY